MPRVSICLPNLNNRPFLEERLQSIYDQTFEDWELVIVDNYSEDGAWDLFQTHAAKESRIRLSQAPKTGMYANWNNTLKQAEGEWLYIATSDDTMYPDCLEKALDGLSRYPDQQVALFGIDVIDAEGRKLEYWHTSSKRPPRYTWGRDMEKEGVLPGEKEFFAQIFACGAYQSITGMLFSKSAFLEAGEYPNIYGSAGDTFWVMELMRRNSFLWLPESLATWRLHGSQASRKGNGKHAAGVSTRDQAVQGALARALEVGWLDHDRLRRIERYQARSQSSQNGLWTSILRKLGRTLGTNPVYAQRAQWVEELLRTTGREEVS